MNARRCARLAVAFVLALSVVSIADGGTMFLSENFDATTVTANLSVPTGWTFGTDSNPHGVAQNNASEYDPDLDSDVTPRTFISTVATNYNTVDFTYEITFSVGGGGSGIAFFGIGSGQPNSNFYDEPYGAFFLRQFPTSFGGGVTGWTISTPSAPGSPSENTFPSSAGGDGTYRARLLKSGSGLTLGIDADYKGGPFSADFTITKSLLTELSFLNATNSRLFFGTADSATTFENLSITAPGPVPEIDPAGLGSVLVLVTAALIEKVPFFKNASSGFLRDLIPRLEARAIAPGEVIVHEGDVGDEMYFLTKGRAEVLKKDVGGPITILQPGSFFGELAILHDAARAATVRALTDVEVYALRREGVLQLARVHADFNEYLLAAAREYAGHGPPSGG